MENCPKCGDRVTTSLTSLCHNAKCGWSQSGSGYESLVKDRDEWKRKYEAAHRLAVRYAQDLSVKMENEDFVVPGWAYTSLKVDAEIEKRLSESKG